MENHVVKAVASPGGVGGDDLVQFALVIDDMGAEKERQQDSPAAGAVLLEAGGDLGDADLLGQAADGHKGQDYGPGQEGHGHELEDGADVMPPVVLQQLRVDLVPVDEAVYAQRGRGKQPDGDRAAALRLDAAGGWRPGWDQWLGNC